MRETFLLIPMNGQGQQVGNPVDAGNDYARALAQFRKINRDPDRRFSVSLTGPIPIRQEPQQAFTE